MSLLINLHHLLKRGKAADSLLSVVLSVRLSSAKLVKHLTCHALKSESSLTGTKRHFLFFLFFFRCFAHCVIMAVQRWTIMEYLQGTGHDREI